MKRKNDHMKRQDNAIPPSLEMLMLEMLIIMMNRCDTLHAPPMSIRWLLLFLLDSLCNTPFHPNAVIKTKMRLSTSPKKIKIVEFWKAEK